MQTTDVVIVLIGLYILGGIVTFTVRWTLADPWERPGGGRPAAIVIAALWPLVVTFLGLAIFAYALMTFVDLGTRVFDFIDDWPRKEP